MRTHVACLICLTLSVTSFATEPLTIGDPAPKLFLKEFVKGEPVKELKKGTVYVIEFSGTQCASCVKAMPILSDLQKKYPKVPIISIYMEKPDVVKEYVEKNKDKMVYTVCVDDKVATSKSWMNAAEMDGIPTIFIVNDQTRIAWIGSPFEMTKPLEAILQGTFDADRARVILSFQQATNRESAATFRNLDQYNETIGKALQFIHKKEFAQSIELLDKAIRDNRDWEYGYSGIKLAAYAQNPETTEQTIKFAANLYGKFNAARLEKHIIRDIGSYCVDYSFTLLSSRPKEPNRLFLEAADLFIQCGEEQLSKMKETTTDARREKDLLTMRLAKNRVDLHQARGEFEKAITLHHKVVEMRNRIYNASFLSITEAEWQKRNAEWIKRDEEKLTEIKQALAKQAKP
jgi:thiol-disulfide isomerase/thioredoxin